MDERCLLANDENKKLERSDGRAQTNVARHDSRATTIFATTFFHLILKHGPIFAFFDARILHLRYLHFATAISTKIIQWQQIVSNELTEMKSLILKVDQINARASWFYLLWTDDIGFTECWKVGATFEAWAAVTIPFYFIPFLPLTEWTKRGKMITDRIRIRNVPSPEPGGPNGEIKNTKIQSDFVH